MKKHLLFLPDIFLVLLILFTCERIDLTDWRNSSNSDSFSDKINAIAPEQLSTTTTEITTDIEARLPGYKERAKLILNVFSVTAVEN
nr:hypothetical protein [Cytophagales bacterium]